MKPLLLLLFLISVFGGGLQSIATINRYAKEAAQAYQQQDYTLAIVAYEYLLNDLEVQDDQIGLNLAHAYFKSNLLDQALQQYQQLANHPFQHIRAVAALQTGNIAVRKNKYKQALHYFKKALIAEPANESARYNYELLKKYLALHPEVVDAEDEPLDSEPENADTTADETPPATTEELAPAPKKKPDSQGTEQEEIETQEQSETGASEKRSRSENSPQQNTSDIAEQTNKEQEQAAGQISGDTEGVNMDNNPEQTQSSSRTSSESTSDEDQRAQTRRSRLQQMNISPEKAQLLLDAMQSVELQYIQQLPKKSTKKPDTSKPDW
ncbi:aerotolerance protein [Pontibacter sp. 13R65]|uniref:aerotolerance protein n=1 Tax=Pontibacter sp. 13R65 TaxID=3127458 RepID=UPI00301B9BC8